jgi:DNA gyrase subunit A
LRGATDERRTVLPATARGFGTPTPISEYTKHGRGGQGLIAIQASERNGALVGAVLVEDGDQVMLISTGGVLIRMAVAQIREQGRSTQGVTLINLDEGEKLAGMERIEEKDEVAGDNGSGGGDGHGAGPEAGDGSDGEPPLPEGDSPAPTVH